ncbi:MAG: hypothetical protein OXP10_04355 [Chloroflexota bacterium]|nr:hypothetical protein [Chloroflexota bacterium]MDE2941558.1 hypothetical protein [Chloroflexota bacterium]
MPRYRKKVCRVCGRIYVRGYVRTAGVLGWCQPECYAKDLRRRREGIPQGQPPRPVDDAAIREPRVLEALASVLREASPEPGTFAGDSETEEAEETGAMTIEVVVDRALVGETRLGEDGQVEVEWVGRCWAWLTEGDAPSLMDVVVRDGEIVKLLEPGQVRRVRAIEQTLVTDEGEVGGLEVWMEFSGFRAQTEPDARAAAMGLREGEKVRIVGEHRRAERGKIGTLLRFTAGVVEVEGERFGTGLDKLEPLDSPDESPSQLEEGVVGEDGAIGEGDGRCELLVEVVAERALFAQTLFGDGGRVGVEWVGRCWVWLSEGEAPSLMEVVVGEAQVARLLEPGQVRRVRARERTIETAEGEVNGLELRAESGKEPEPDLREVARGLWEGGKVRIPPDRPWRDEEGKVGTLLRFSLAYIEMDGRRLPIAPRDLEPVDSPEESSTGPGRGESQTEG